MGRERDLLLDSIRHALAGNDAGADGLSARLPNPTALDRIEKAAWIALSNWHDETELRASHHSWDCFAKQRLRHLLTVL